MNILKISLITVFVLILTPVFSQLDARTGSNEGVVRGSNIKSSIYRNKSAFYVKPLGTPYNSIIFLEVKVENIIENSKMRFNIYSDEFEFINSKNDTLILDKNENFKNLRFIASNVKYKLVNYVNFDSKTIYGYLMDVYKKNEINLFKKERVQFNEEKIARTSLETNLPAKFYNEKSIYFFSNKNVIQELPSKKKGLIKLFPDKKEAIEKFFKENKINFSDENDLKKLVDLIAGF